jgi:hypothetical protein
MKDLSLLVFLKFVEISVISGFPFFPALMVPIIWLRLFSIQNSQTAFFLFRENPDREKGEF